MFIMLGIFIAYSVVYVYGFIYDGKYIEKEKKEMRNYEKRN